MKKSNDTIGNQNRELLTCSAVPQPTVQQIGRMKLPTRQHHLSKWLTFF